MNQITPDKRSLQVDQQLDPEVIAFRQKCDDRTPLDVPISTVKIDEAATSSAQ